MRRPCQIFMTPTVCAVFGTWSCSMYARSFFHPCAVCMCICVWQSRRCILICHAERKGRTGLHIILAWRKSEAKTSFSVTGWLGTPWCAVWPVLYTDCLVFRQTLTEWEVIRAYWANCALKWIDGDQKGLWVLLSIQQYNHTNRRDVFGLVQRLAKWVCGQIESQTSW